MLKEVEEKWATEIEKRCMSPLHTASLKYSKAQNRLFDLVVRPLKKVSEDLYRENMKEEREPEVERVWVLKWRVYYSISMHPTQTASEDVSCMKRCMITALWLTAIPISQIYYTLIRFSLTWLAVNSIVAMLCSPLGVFRALEDSNKNKNICIFSCWLAFLRPEGKEWSGHPHLSLRLNNKVSH